MKNGLAGKYSVHCVITKKPISSILPPMTWREIYRAWGV